MLASRPGPEAGGSPQAVRVDLAVLAALWDGDAPASPEAVWNDLARRDAEEGR